MIKSKDIIQEINKIHEGLVSSILDKLRNIGKRLITKEAPKTSNKPIYIPNTNPEIYNPTSDSPELLFSFMIDFKNQLDTNDWNTASKESLIAPSKWVDSLYKFIKKLTKKPYHLSDKVTESTYILFYLSIYGTSSEQINSIYTSLIGFFEKTCEIKGKIPGKVKEGTKRI
jgi:hypothetical protein